MQTVDLDVKAKFMHGFSHKVRIQILEILKDGELTVSEIMEQVKGSQSSISQHLACLKGCGLIVNRQEGKFVFYQLASDKILDLLNQFDDVFLDVAEDVDACDSHIG